MAGRALVPCVLCALAGCGPSWAVVTDALDRVVLTASGDADQVLIAGGGQGNGAPSLLRRLKANAWESLDPQATETLWWTGSGFAVGERGAIYRVDGGEKLATPTAATLFGVWGAWAVGGSPLGNGENDVLLRLEGGAWTKVAPPEALDVAYFKVWGAAEDDVWVVGQQGLALHWDGAQWRRVTTPTRATLLTVAGRASNDVWAVGGPPAVLLHWDGSAWRDEALPFDDASGLTGVALGPGGELFVVGLAGVRWRRSASGTWSDDTESPALGDLHAVWVAPDGTAWAVGGNYIATDPGTPRKGIVARWGRGTAPALK